ncbi:MAG: hypothetical protein QXD13_01100 [Candidatus Pacearchaeota archaeon]
MIKMVIRARENVVGAYAFLIGVILSVIVGVFVGFFGGEADTSTVTWVFIGLGVVAGYFVAEKDVQTFLLAAVSLVLVSYIGISGMMLSAAIRGVGIGQMLSSILGTLITLFVPATIVVALKTVFSISKS